MLVQTNWVELDRLQLYERMVAELNRKAVSCATFGFQTVGIGNQVWTYYVPEGSTLQILAVSAIAQTAGAGGANGITLSFTGGAAAQTVQVLPVAAVLTQLYPGVGFSTPYVVPSQTFVNCTITADDHGAAPEDVWVFLTIRLV